MKCKQCGAEIENSRCCPYCGSENADYDAAAAVQQEAARQRKAEQGKGRDIHDSEKSKTVAFLLALFSGPLGLHNFYTCLLYTSCWASAVMCLPSMRLARWITNSKSV